MTNDVVIIGGGLVGTATAYFCARAGLRVTLLEADRLAAGASGANPGFVWLHCRNPGWALDVSRRGRRLYDELQAELPGAFELRASGGLIYFTDEAQAPAFAEFAALRRSQGLDVTLIDGAEVRRLVAPIRPDVLGASHCADDAQIDARSVVAALARGAAALGADIREGVRVTGLLRSGEATAGVRWEGGRLEAGTVVAATGTWTPGLLAPAGVDVPIGTARLQLAATEPQPAQIGPVLYGPSATAQYSLFRDLPSWREAAFPAPDAGEPGAEMLTLAVQRPGGEVIVGAPMDYAAEPRTTPAAMKALRRVVASELPGLRDAPIARRWAGVMPFTADLLPFIDRADPGLVVAAGHVFGNSAGPATGLLVSELVRGVEPSLPLTGCELGRPSAAVGGPVRW